jgi:hypothetical protein
MVVRTKHGSFYTELPVASYKLDSLRSLADELSFSRLHCRCRPPGRELGANRQLPEEGSATCQVRMPVVHP